MQDSTRKIAVIGAGSVGATIAYACMIRGVAKQIALYDVDKKKVEAEVLDLNHGLLFVPMATLEGSDDVNVCKDADVVVITAGAKQKPGTLKLSSLPKNKVFGSGTVLDSSRFRFLIAQRLKVAVQNVHAYIAGEHGDSEVPLWSSATVANIPLHEWAVRGHGKLSVRDRAEIFDNVKNAAYQIVAGKGATNFAIGLATARILEALLHDENRILSVSSLLEDYRGISDVCLSVPHIVGAQGVEAPLPVPMNANEEAGLKNSAETIRAAIEKLGF